MHTIYTGTIYLKAVMAFHRQAHIYQTLHTTQRNMPAAQPDLLTNFSPTSSVLHAMLHSGDLPSSRTLRMPVPLLKSHMEEDSRVWPPERLQRPTRCQQTGSTCSSSTTPTTRQSWRLLATHTRRCTRQRRLYQTHRLCNGDLDRRQIPTTNLEPLQNQQLSRGLAQQTLEESEDGSYKHLQDHRRIQEREGSNWSQDGTELNSWLKEKTYEEVPWYRRTTTASENQTDIRGKELHPIRRLSILHLEARLITEFTTLSVLWIFSVCASWILMLYCVLIFLVIFFYGILTIFNVIVCSFL